MPTRMVTSTFVYRPGRNMWKHHRQAGAHSFANLAYERSKSKSAPVLRIVSGNDEPRGARGARGKCRVRNLGEWGIPYFLSEPIHRSAALSFPTRRGSCAARPTDAGRG